jgi:hypothetical protein
MKQQINEIKRMQQLAGIITESQLNEYDEEGSGYSYEYKEGPGASPKEIADTIKQYQKDKFTWEKLAKKNFYSMADGESADIKSEYYPQWKKSDFQQVIDALEGGSTSIKENEHQESVADLVNRNLNKFEKAVNAARLKKGEEEMSVGDFEMEERGGRGEDIAVDSLYEPGERGTFISFNINSLKDSVDNENEVDSTTIDGKTVYFYNFSD